MRSIYSLILFLLCFLYKAQNNYDKSFYLIEIKPDFVFDASEKRNVDSVLKLYHTTGNDTLRYNYLKFFSERLNDEYLWTTYTKYLYAKVKGGNDSLKKYFEATALNNLGYELQYIKNDLEGARKAYLESYTLFKEIRESGGLGVEINNLAYIYQHEGNIQKSLELYTEAGELFEKLNAPLGLTSIYINIGDIYFHNEELEKAEEFFNKAAYFALQTKQESVIANTYNQLATINSRKGNVTKAIDYYKQALALYEKEKNYSRVALICIGLSKVYFEKKDNSTYESYVKRAYSNSLLSTDLQIKAKVYERVGLMYMNLRDYKNAFFYTDTSYMYAKKLVFPELVSDAALNLSIIHKQKGNYELAYRFLREAKSIQDSMGSDAARKAVIKSQYQIEYNKKNIELKAEQEKKDAIRSHEKRQQQVVLFLTIIVLLIITALASIAFRSYKKTKKQKQVIENQKLEVTTQKNLVEEKQKEIIDSITYAKRLQEAILPPKSFIDSYLPQNFILYTPKDLVAGDFYWAEKVGDLFFIAAADSTGHGVPGAMVSVVCSNALNRSVKEFKLSETGKILDKTRELVVETFEKSNNNVKDGMDISLLCIDLKNLIITWSGANNPLWYVKNDILTEIKGDKQPIGKTDSWTPFHTQAVPFEKGTSFYLFTDGLADQFGGPNGKKYKYKQFSSILKTNSALPISQQQSKLEESFTSWKGNLEQVDDVCVVGIVI